MESTQPDNTGPNAPADATSEAIAGHLIDFLSHEVDKGRLPNNLLPIQSGIGNIANAVVGGLAQGPFNDVTVYVLNIYIHDPVATISSWAQQSFQILARFTEVLQDKFLDFFESQKLKYASATSIRFSPDGFKRFYDNWEHYRVCLILFFPTPSHLQPFGCAYSHKTML